MGISYWYTPCLTGIWPIAVDFPMNYYVKRHKLCFSTANSLLLASVTALNLALLSSFGFLLNAFATLV